MIEILLNKIRKANKNHICDFCGFTINKGDRYSISSIVDSGTVYTWKSHISCEKLCSIFDEYNEGMSSNEFWDRVVETYSENILDNATNIRDIPYEEMMEKVKEFHKIS